MALIVSLSDMKTYLGISGTTYDSQVTAMINAATKRMEQRAGRCFLPVTETIYLNGNGQEVIWLPEPADSVTSVHEDNTRTWDAGSLVSSEDYMVDGCQLERLDTIWMLGQRNIKVVYSVGFSTMPADITDAAKVQVAAMFSTWLAAKKGQNILQSERIETWSRTYLERHALEPEVETICDSYAPERT